MGTWSQFLRCSWPEVAISRRSAPRGLLELLDQHGEGCVEGWGDDGPPSSPPHAATWGAILSSFSEASRIWGYFTDEYRRKWEEALAFVDGLQLEADAGAAEPWVLFYCSDAQLVYSIRWDRLARKLVVSSMRP